MPMLAVLVGSLALLLGLALMLLPLLTPELARPRDALWAAVVLLLGLVLVTAAERLTGAPMLGVLCGGLLIGRLGTEVAQQRWLQLPSDGRHQLRDLQLWKGRLGGLGRSFSQLLGLAAGLLSWIKERLAKAKAPITKKWVRAEETPAAQTPEPAGEELAGAVSAVVEVVEVLEVVEVVEAPEQLQEAENEEPELAAGEIGAGEIPAAELAAAAIIEVEAEAIPSQAPAAVPPGSVIQSLDEVDALLDAAEHG